MNTLQSIRLRALALRSTIHNEQMLSALELSAMCAKKTNEIIEVVNDLCNYVEALALSVDFVYDPETESLNAVVKMED